MSASSDPLPIAGPYGLRAAAQATAALNAEANPSTMFEFRRARPSLRQKPFGPGAFDLSFRTASSDATKAPRAL
jgi:hypothetical protein